MGVRYAIRFQETRERRNHLKKRFKFKEFLVENKNLFRTRVVVSWFNSFGQLAALAMEESWNYFNVNN